MVGGVIGHTGLSARETAVVGQKRTTPRVATWVVDADGVGEDRRKRCQHGFGSCWPLPVRNRTHAAKPRWVFRHGRSKRSFLSQSGGIALEGDARETLCDWLLCVSVYGWHRRRKGFVVWVDQWLVIQRFWSPYTKTAQVGTTCRIVAQPYKQLRAQA